MEIQVWWIWIIFAALFMIGEIFTAGFFLFWFGVGAAVAGFLAYLDLGAAWQWGSFVIISGTLFLISRRFAERFTKKQPPGIGADRWIGKKGLVLEKIDNERNTGRVRIGREEWRAESDSEKVIEINKKVRVTRMDGTHIVVKPIEKGE